jgi:pimeloyl-ACP methyl ester carboxylesterase
LGCAAPTALAWIFAALSLAVFQPEAAALTPCRLGGLAHEVSCGVVKRPLDPANPQGTQIDVHYAVLPALARNKEPDPIFFFAGGPGQSAIDLAGQLAARLQRLINRRDLVLIDQRGTGRSAPLECDDDDLALPLAELLDPARQLARLESCREKLQKQSHGDLRFYTTTLAAQDADAVRRALGAARIDLMGVSNGTRVALEYQRLFPRAVRRAVLDGAAPPDMVLPAAYAVDNQAALDALFAACERDPACERRYPALRDRWRKLLSTLPRAVTIEHPLTARAERMTMTREFLLYMVRLPLYVPSLTAALPQAIADADAGRFESLAALASTLYGRRREMALYTGMHFSVVCSEDAPLLARATTASAADFGRAFVEQYTRACARWPRGAVSEAFYGMPPAPAATLVLSGGIDPATPPRHGERVAAALGPKARHVVVPNSGHGVMSVGCMRDVVYRFVIAEDDDEALKVDARCVDAIPRPSLFTPITPIAGGAR